jgi:hypothetical protein
MKEHLMWNKTKCILCENEALEHAIRGEDKYEVRCNTCRVFFLTRVQDIAFSNLPIEFRSKLSAYVRDQFTLTGVPVHLDWVENFITIIAEDLDCKDGA